MTPRQRFLAGRLAYAGIVLLATLTDLDLEWDALAFRERLVRALEPSMGWRDAVDGLRNVALFAGLGMVWVVTSLSGKVRADMRRAALVGLALSATIEGLQLFSPVRTASVVDLATNTAGAFAGGLALVLLIAAVQQARGARSYLGVPGFTLAGAYGLAVLCEAVTPLFRNEPLAYAGGPLASLRVALSLSTPLSFGGFSLVDVILFAPASFLVVMMLAERGYDLRTMWPRVAGAAAAAVVAAEVSHGPIGLPIRWEAAAAHILGATLGAALAWRWIPPLSRTLRGPDRPRAALAAYAALTVFWGWRPFVPETDAAVIAKQFQLGHLVPLMALGARVDVFSAFHVAQQFLLYVPLGCVLAVWPLRLSGRWAHLWPALALVVVIELGHIVIAGRFFDVTNALIGCAGAAVGWVTVRRSGFLPYGALLPEAGS